MKRVRCLPGRESEKSRGALQEAERRQNRKKAGGQAAEAPRAAWPGDFPSVYKTALFSGPVFPRRGSYFAGIPVFPVNFTEITKTNWRKSVIIAVLCEKAHFGE
jgi:hypothetical protein